MVHPGSGPSFWHGGGKHPPKPFPWAPGAHASAESGRVALTSPQAVTGPWAAVAAGTCTCQMPEQDKLNGYQTLKTVLFHHQHSFPNKGESVSHSSFGHAQVKEPYTQGCLAPLSTLPDWLLPGLHEMHSHIQVFTMLSGEPGEPCSQHCCPSALLSPCRRHPYLSSLPRGSYLPGRFSWPSVLGRRAHPAAQPHPL